MQVVNMPKIKIKESTSLSLGVSTTIRATFDSEVFDSWKSNRRRFDGDRLSGTACILTRAVVGDVKGVEEEVKQREEGGRRLKEAGRGLQL